MSALDDYEEILERVLEDFERNSGVGDKAYWVLKWAHSLLVEIERRERVRELKKERDSLLEYTRHLENLVDDKEDLQHLKKSMAHNIPELPGEDKDGEANEEA